LVLAGLSFPFFKWLAAEFRIRGYSPRKSSSFCTDDFLPMTRNAPIHVLTLTPFYPSRGDERGGFVAEPLRELEGLGLSSSIIAVRPFHKGRVLPSLTVPAATWVRYPVLPGNRGLASAGRLLFLRIRSLVQQLHRDHPIDVLHAHAPLPCGEAARRLSGDLDIPFVITVHGLDAYLTKQVAGSAGDRCAQLCRQVYTEAGRIPCISEQVRQQVLERMPGLKNTGVVYNGVDTTAFFPAATPPSGDRTPEVPVIASTGSLIAIKGHDVTLRALAKLCSEFPNLRCRMIGEGVELNRLRSLAQELGVSEKVEFLGRQTRLQVAQVLQESTIFALPSRYEGLGCAYLEAMASGLPTIACRGQGIDEVIRDGENGLLLPPNDPDGLAGVLRRLLTDPDLRRSMGSAARSTVVESYTLRHQAEELLGIYEECMA
jgi:glycosyltransferase involved in cell wall biosynthesis